MEMEYIINYFDSKGHVFRSFRSFVPNIDTLQRVVARRLNELPVECVRMTVDIAIPAIVNIDFDGEQVSVHAR
jgi:hypothetical protein